MRLASSTFSSRSSAAASPASRSRLASRRSRTASHARSSAAPTFSESRIHDRPEKTLNAEATTATRTRVAPVKPSAAMAGPAASSPTAPPGSKPSAGASECMRSVASVQVAATSTTKPASATTSERRFTISHASTRG